jgi:hypothetical protein
VLRLLLLLLLLLCELFDLHYVLDSYAHWGGS